MLVADDGRRGRRRRRRHRSNSSNGGGGGGRHNDMQMNVKCKYIHRHACMYIVYVHVCACEYLYTREHTTRCLKNTVMFAIFGGNFANVYFFKFKTLSLSKFRFYILRLNELYALSRDDNLFPRCSIIAPPYHQPLNDVQTFTGTCSTVVYFTRYTFVQLTRSV